MNAGAHDHAGVQGLHDFCGGSSTSALVFHDPTVGQEMKALATGKTFKIWECPHATVTAEAAIEEAKTTIDGSGRVWRATKSGPRLNSWGFFIRPPDARVPSVSLRRVGRSSRVLAGIEQGARCRSRRAKSELPLNARTAPWLAQFLCWHRRVGIVAGSRMSTTSFRNRQYQVERNATETFNFRTAEIAPSPPTSTVNELIQIPDVAAARSNRAVAVCRP
jgi:hypothetical protein